jgi:hypothetical protein
MRSQLFERLFLDPLRHVKRLRVPSHVFERLFNDGFTVQAVLSSVSSAMTVNFSDDAVTALQRGQCLAGYDAGRHR